jgi:hypothetical protein
MGGYSSEYQELQMLFLLLKNSLYNPECPETKNKEWMGTWNKLEKFQAKISKKYL